MKKILAVSLLMALPLILLAFGIVSSQEIKPLEGRIIALDAGHGGDSLGATYPPGEGETADVYEKDINIATVFALKEKLEDPDSPYGTAKVVLTRECDETIPRRKDRVAIAKDKCAELDLDNDGLADGRECDVLVSLHHNGDPDETYDGMMVIYNNKEDLVLATYLHDRLLGGEFDGLFFDGLFKGDTTYDEGYDRGGYGMTVYFTPASLTEGYYVTNKCEAELFSPDSILAEGEWNETDCPSKIYGDSPNATTTHFYCNAEGTTRDFDYGPERVNQEAEALYWGLIDYFSAPSENGGGNGGDKCPPGNPDHPKCK